MKAIEPKETVQVERVNLEIENNAEDNVIRLTRLDKCRVLCGIESILVTVMVIGLGGGHFYIFQMYRSNPGPKWVFLVLLCILAWFNIRTFCVVFSNNTKKDNTRGGRRRKKKSG